MVLEYVKIANQHGGFDSIDYLLGGMLTLRNGRIDQYQFEEGYCQANKYSTTADKFTFCYYDQDHLGNIRQVTQDNGTSKGKVIQKVSYYPFGLQLCDGTTDSNVQSHRYNGKELDKMHGLNTYDYGARQYNPVTARWDRIDPLVEKYYSISPYAYCAGNPVKYVDPDGRQLGDFVDEKGKVIGNDGIDDGKMYVLKTSKNEFKEGESDPDPVSGAGVRERTLKQAKNFITQNSGNKDAFAENNIAYQNSVEVQPAAMRRKMVDEVANKDDGKWSTKAENNREYGADLYPWEASVGAINTVLGKGAEVYLNHNGCTCHTHCSGFVYSNGRQSGYVQHPSSTDLKMAGEHTCYVFGARNGVTYIYNRTGVLATIPTNKFVNPDKK